ncbi:MAG: nuclear transport factor 2 family protein [Cyclobacteriaceae bacterium]
MNVVEQFYTAFQAKDAKGMKACYHAEIEFEDPAFGLLKGDQAGMMWQMLCEQGKDLEISFRDVIIDGDQASAKWEAKYTFSRTGRWVHNRISASFRLKDNLIIEHKDEFNLHRWARQAMGFQGALLGWTKFFKAKFQVTAKKALGKYIAHQ